MIKVPTLWVQRMNSKGHFKNLPPHQNEAFSSGKWKRLAGLDQKHPNCKSYGWVVGAINRIPKKHFVIITQNTWNKLEW